MQIVNGGQHGAQHLATSVEVMQIGAAKAFPAAFVPGHTQGARAGITRARGV